MTTAEFSAKWDIRFRDNTFFEISETDLREFKDDLLVVFGLQGSNVPYYKAGTDFQKDYLVRYLIAGQAESFFYSLKAGKLPAPTAGGDTNWKVVPGPVSPTALSQALSLLQAQNIQGDQVVAGRDYLINFGNNAAGYQQTVTVRGISNSSFDTVGTLEVDGVMTPVYAIDVFAGTYKAIPFGVAALLKYQEKFIYGAQGSLAVTDVSKSLVIRTNNDLATLTLPDLALSQLPAQIQLTHSPFSSGGGSNVLRVVQANGTAIDDLYPTERANFYAVEMPAQPASQYPPTPAKPPYAAWVQTSKLRSPLILLNRGQALDLRIARRLIPGQRYVVSALWNNSTDPIGVYVSGATESSFDLRGTIYLTGQPAQAVEAIDTTNFTYTVSGASTGGGGSTGAAAVTSVNGQTGAVVIGVPDTFDVYDLPAQKIVDVKGAYTSNGNKPVEETNSKYFWQSFNDTTTTPGVEYEVKCTPSTANGATVWKWRYYKEGK